MELVPQEVKRDPVLDKAEDVMEYVNPEGEIAEHNIRKMFSGLGIGEIDLEAKPQSFSGGVKTKLALARALFKEPDILLLDEPTNFMDLEGKKWVMGLLARYPKTLILISHDLGLMDRAIDRVMYVNKHKHLIEEYKGNYSQYIRQQKEADTRFKKQVVGQQKVISKLEHAIKVMESRRGL